MKLRQKLILISSSVLLGLAPVAASSISPVQAAVVHKTYGKNSRVKTIKRVHFVNAKGKTTKKVAAKGGQYIIWDVQTIKGQTYLAIQSNLKYWLPATAVSGMVQYRHAGKTVSLTINKGKVSQSSKKAAKKAVKKTSKKTAKKTVKKAKTSKKTAKKTNKKTVKKAKKSNKKQAYKVTLIKTIRRTHVVDKNGKNVKTYMGSKRYAVIGKNVNLKGLGKKTINGKQYYALTPNKYYIAAKDVKSR
jgi:hypothetical protein